LCRKKRAVFAIILKDPFRPHGYFCTGFSGLLFQLRGDIHFIDIKFHVRHSLLTFIFRLFRIKEMKNHPIRTTLYLLVTFVLISCGTANENNGDDINFNPVDINDGWDISTAAEQGLDTGRVYEMYQEASRISHLYSLIIVKNGSLVAEAYFNGKGFYDANSIASVTKSVVSTLAGIALDQHILTGVNQKITVFFPEIDWAAQDPGKSLITVQQILQMRSGYPWEEFEGYLDILLASNAWIPYLGEFPLTSDPGTRFGYSNFTAHMMGIILARA
jgi:CubicO group peptidase (beta-lactamase class C family)